MATQHQLHVVMFPWLAHGHITPFLELAKSLLTYELRISFVSTPLNIARVKKQIVPGIELVELPLPSIDGLPVGVESTAEGLRFGVPFVALPIQYEQGLTARLIADELRMGVEVKRNEEDGSFTKEDIARGVRAVMVGQEGCRIKSNVQEISRVLTSNDSQIHRTNIHKFFSALKEKASSKQTV
ncbi:hypothetical protein SUGI_1127830 [Cryptomeria japonica]|nr:hypothetical protein SUGI_1127830 [Cryptomeria japonica]